MRSLACSAPEILVAHVAAHTRRVRVGAAGIMLPNHASLKVAETFRTLVAMHPDRIDLALGRAPGTDPLTAHVLRRLRVDPAAEFPQQVAELLASLGDGFPDDHP
jgi:luciferase family oxidoreductase group 1